MQLNYIHDIARLQIDSTIIYMHAGLFTCLFIVCSFFYLSFYLNYLIKKILGEYHRRAKQFGFGLSSIFCRA